MFQFTCPSRSTTPRLILLSGCPKVSIHVPLAEHDAELEETAKRKCVSIHVPLAEHDRIRGDLRNPSRRFNSRAPRGARRPSWRRQRRSSRFNSRAPRGARLHGRVFAMGGKLFQFTCPSRSTTWQISLCLSPQKVSIHVPLAEHDGCSPRGLNT